MEDGLLVLLQHLLDLLAALAVDLDVVGDVEARLLPHGLQLADDFPHKALADKLLGEGGVQHHGDAPVGHRGVALLLGGLDEQLLGGERNVPIGQGELQHAGGVQLLLGRGAVQLLQSLAGVVQALAQLLAQQLQLGLKGVGRKLGHIREELHVLHVELLLDDVRVQLPQAGVGVGVQRLEGLAVLQVGEVPGGAAQGDHLEHLVHLSLQLFVHAAFLIGGVQAQVDALRGGLVHGAHQVAVDFLAHKGGHGGGHLGGGHQRRVQGHKGGGAVVALRLGPEPGTAAAHVPVAHLVHKILEGTGGLGHLVGGEVVIHGLHGGVQPGEQPLVHHGELAVLQPVLGGVKVYNVGVHHKEGVSVPQGGEELLLPLNNGLLVEAAGQPGGGVGVEVPAQGVRAELLQGLHGVHGVALGLGHLLAVLVLHQALDQHVLKGGLVKQQGGDGQQAVEPAAGLVHGLGDEVRGELALEKLLVLKGIVVLGKGHGAGVEPAVDDLGHTVHLLAAVGAGDGHLVHIGPVQLDVVGAILRHLLQLRDAADGVAVAALTLPDVQRGTPIAVAADGPVLDVLQPVAKAALADAFGVPLDGVVVGNQLLLHVGHLDVPGLPGVVDKGGVAAPAEGVAVLELGRAEQQAPLIQILQDFLVGVLAEHAGPLGFTGHLALAVHQLHQGQAVLAAHLGVVLTKGRGDVHHAGAVGESDVIVAHHVPALLLGADKVEQGLVLLALQIGALVSLQDGVLPLAQDGVAQGGGQVVGLPLALHLYIVLGGVDAQRHVGGQRPGGGGPGQDEGLLTLDPELGDGGALLHVLVALGHLVGGKGRAAAGAIGHNLKALVQKALVPNLLEGPPLALDEVVVIGDVGVLHVGPEAHVLGEILPQALVLPHALLALLDEGGNAIGLDLLLAVDVQQLFHFQLHGQAVGIPAGLAGDHLPFHGVEPGEQVLKGPGLQVADVGLAVGGGGAVVEDIGVVALALLHALFEDVVFFPEFFRFLLPLHKIQVGGDFLVHAHGSHPFSGLCSPELTEKIKKPRPAQTGRRLGFAYTTHSGISNNTRPGNGGVPAALTGGFAGKPCWARGSGGMRHRVSRAGSHHPPAL